MSSTKRDEAIERFANGLSDYEFEMLLRRRINIHRDLAVLSLENMGVYVSDYYRAVQFVYNNEGGKWIVTLGKSYDDAITEKGEVLSQTLADAVEANRRKHGNKLSLLLPAPELVMNNQDDPGDADKPSTNPYYADPEPPAFDAPEIADENRPVQDAERGLNEPPAPTFI